LIIKKIVDTKGPVLTSARRARFIVRITCAVIGIVVGYLQLRNLPFVQIVNNLSGELIMKSSLILFYFSWFLGTINDANDQELVLANPKVMFPNFLMVLIIFFLSGFFILLCLATTFKARILLLFAVIIMDRVALYYYRSKLVLNAFKFSKDEYEKGKKFIWYIKLDAVQKYLYGKWNNTRFTCGMVFLLVLLFFIYSPINKLIESQINKFSNEILYSLSFLIFVLLYEGFTWIKRFEIKIVFKTVEGIIEHHQKMVPGK
jgi:hypothetical protein